MCLVGWSQAPPGTHRLGIGLQLCPRNAYTPQDIMGGIAASEVLLPEVLGVTGYRWPCPAHWVLPEHVTQLPLKTFVKKS